MTDMERLAAIEYFNRTIPYMLGDSGEKPMRLAIEALKGNGMTRGKYKIKNCDSKDFPECRERLSGNMENYKQYRKAIDKMRKYREALEKIKKHIEIISPSGTRLSTIHNIAKQALEGK